LVNTFATEGCFTLILGILGYLPPPAFTQAYQSLLPLFQTYAEGTPKARREQVARVVYQTTCMMQNFRNPHPEGLDAHITVLMSLLRDPDPDQDEEWTITGDFTNRTVLDALGKLSSDAMARHVDLNALQKKYSYTASQPAS